MGNINFRNICEKHISFLIENDLETASEPSMFHFIANVTSPKVLVDIFESISTPKIATKVEDSCIGENFPHLFFVPWRLGKWWLGKC